MIPQASEVDKERLEVALKRVTKDSQRRAPGVFEKSLGMFWGMKEGGKNGGMISICSKFYRFYDVVLYYTYIYIHLYIIYIYINILIAIQRIPSSTNHYHGNSAKGFGCRCLFISHR